jgi:hypothetical protein
MTEDSAHLDLVLYCQFVFDDLNHLRQPRKLETYVRTRVIVATGVWEARSGYDAYTASV